jgi:spore germination cell wall hydrolase CwlJ-like protein
LADGDIFIVPEVDLDLVGRILKGECDGEPDDGIRAVAFVIKTRTLWTPPEWWGTTIRQVCLKGTIERTSIIHQFSCVNDQAGWETLLRVPQDDPDLARLKGIASACFRGEAQNPAPGSTHYRRFDVNADWSIGRVGSRIGKHVFFAVGPGA